MQKSAIVGLRAGEFVRYFLASLVALTIDFAVLLLAADYMHFLLAATLGFVTGATTIYLLAIGWVFQRRRMANQQHFELFSFLAIGMLGLGLSDLVIFAAVGIFDAPLVMGKFFAATAGFLFNYTARKLALF